MKRCSLPLVSKEMQRKRGTPHTPVVVAQGRGPRVRSAWSAPAGVLKDSASLEDGSQGPSSQPRYPGATAMGVDAKK